MKSGDHEQYLEIDPLVDKGFQRNYQQYREWGRKAMKTGGTALRGLLSVLLAVALSRSSATATEASPPLRKKVLIIGVDGCRPDALRVATIPNLNALIQEGAFSDQAQTGDVPISGPGWSSMLTGVWRKKHGVKDNSFKQPRFDRYPHFFRRLKEARPNAFTASIVHWEPIHSKIVSFADVSSVEKTDADVAQAARRLLSEHDPDAVFLDFDDVDGAGHSQGYGPSSLAYLKAIEVVDAQIGTVLEALRSRKTYAQEDWLILVSTDHGGSGKRHDKNISENRTLFLIVSGSSAARGRINPPPRIVDIPPTALTHLGVKIDRAWKWDGRAVGLMKTEAVAGR